MKQRHITTVCAVAASTFMVLRGQETAPPTVYTAAQAEAGRAAFQSTCAKCHTGTFLRRTGEPGELPPVDSLPPGMQEVVRGAGGKIPPLAGPDFMAAWGTRTTKELAVRINEAVGGFRPQGADQETYLNLTAYVLQANGAQSGTQTLAPATGVQIRSIAAAAIAQAQAPVGARGGRAARPPAPTRDPHTQGYVEATELTDGANPSPKQDGNFILGPTHPPAPEMTAQEGVPHGTIYNFTMESADSKFYSGVARDPNPPGQTGAPAGGGPRVISNHPAPYTRKVAVYVPKQYVAGMAAPLIVGADGPDQGLFTALDNLIAQHRVPVMIAVSIGNGSGDGPGSERGLEYDTMSGKYAEFVEAEVLPLVEKQYNVRLTKDPEGRATMGGSSGGSVAMAMAWFHPELYHRVLTYSGTYVNNQWPVNPELPHGAWELHEHLIPNSPVKPLCIWMEVGDRDNGGTGDVMHDWVVANENMAKVLAAKGYHYQFSFARNAGHTDRAVKQQTLPEALEYIWQGYSAAAPK